MLCGCGEPSIPVEPTVPSFFLCTCDDRRKPNNQIVKGYDMSGIFLCKSSSIAMIQVIFDIYVKPSFLRIALAAEVNSLKALQRDGQDEKDAGGGGEAWDSNYLFVTGYLQLEKPGYQIRRIIPLKMLFKSPQLRLSHLSLRRLQPFALFIHVPLANNSTHLLIKMCFSIALAVAVPRISLPAKAYLICEAALVTATLYSELDTSRLWSPVSCVG